MNQDTGVGTVSPHARLTVDLGALRANYRHLVRVAPCPAAVIKADGYGLGAKPAFEALREEGCRDFFVGTVEEGLELGLSLRDVRVYVLSGPVDDAGAETMAARDLIPVLNDEIQVRRWQPYRDLPVAVHVDTGMHRLGFPYDALEPALFDNLNVRVVVSHLACADDPADSMNRLQIARFERVRAMFPGAMTSLSNSAGALAGVVSDLPRAGIALVGGNPFATRPNPMKPVATLEAKVVALREVDRGERIGYGGTYTTNAKTCIAVLGVGYADGVPRGLSDEAEVACRGTRLPIIGRVSMDLTHIDATAMQGGLALGDWVEVFGPTVGVDEVAAWSGTISYEVLTRMGHRVGRRYRYRST